MSDDVDRDLLAGLRTPVETPPIEEVVRRGRRWHRRRRIVATATCLVAIAAVAALAVQWAGDDEDLVAAGSGDATSDPLGVLLRAETGDSFPTDPIGGDGRVACLDGQSVRVYVFADAAERQRVSDTIDPDDPSHVGTAIVAWVGQPRLWIDSELLILYAGSDPSTVNRLTEAFGDPIASGQGRVADDAAFGCDAGTARVPPPEPEPVQITEACPSTSDLALHVGDHTVTMVPPGFAPTGPVETAHMGPEYSDLGGESTSTLRFTDEGGRSIDVISYSGYDPRAFVARAHDGATTHLVTLHRCADGADGPTAEEQQAELSVGDGRTVIGAQEWEYGGFVVVGDAGVTLEEVTLVASGLRFP